MLTAVLRYSTSGSPMASVGRGLLANALVSTLTPALPPMIAEAFAPVGHVEPTHMRIDLQPYDVNAFNVAALCLEVQLGRGADDRVFAVRDAIRDSLRRSLLAWLERHMRPEFPEDTFGPGVEIHLLFVDACGMNFNGHTGAINSQWGGVND